MGSEINSDKVTIQNILFTKALPNYTIPVPTDGYKTFPCAECGDKFLFQSSYNDHINRKSLKITYFCRFCQKLIVNNNRCRLLSHIRSHAFKTTTINVSDIKIEPLAIQDINWTLPPTNISQAKANNCNVCYECKATTDRSDNIKKDRANHFMKYTNMVYSCPICLFSLPSVCALKAHLRIHLKVPPYFCPECGVHLPDRSISYPYHHDCEGFNMIRATTRLKCMQKNCLIILHPNDYKMHIRTHFEKVYKCLTCVLVWDTKPPKSHFNCNVVKYFKCHICTNTLLARHEINKHLTSHFKSVGEEGNEYIYPCSSCNVVCKEIEFFIEHQISKHASSTMKELLVKMLNEYYTVYKSKSVTKTGFYRVLKKCDKCLRSFLYRCEYKNIKILPNECPYECSSNKMINITESIVTNENCQIVCYLCKSKIRENWDDIKKHFAISHKNHKCLDLKVMLKKIDERVPNVHQNKNHLQCVKKRVTLKKSKVYLKKSKFHTNRKSGMTVNMLPKTKDVLSQDDNMCSICNIHCENKQALESHIITHKDPCMAYQCLECGQCFVVKPSFSKHLLLEHDIGDIDEYISKKQCYNESALLKQPNSGKLEDDPIKENQCQICRDQFSSHIDLEKHFRIHGMAFLMKNTNKSNST